MVQNLLSREQIFPSKFMIKSKENSPASLNNRTIPSILIQIEFIVESSILRKAFKI